MNKQDIDTLNKLYPLLEKNENEAMDISPEAGEAFGGILSDMGHGITTAKLAEIEKTIDAFHQAYNTMEQLCDRNVLDWAEAEVNKFFEWEDLDEGQDDGSYDPKWSDLAMSITSMGDNLSDEARNWRT